LGSGLATADAMMEYNHAGSPQILVVFSEKCPSFSSFILPPFFVAAFQTGDFLSAGVGVVEKYEIGLRHLEQRGPTLRQHPPEQGQGVVSDLRLVRHERSQ